MQIYADILGRPMKISGSDQTCALGAAIFGAISAGQEASGYADVGEAQKAMTRCRETVYTPDPNNQRIYAEIYQLYLQLHDAFGTEEWSGKMGNVMKDLLEIRELQR